MVDVRQTTVFRKCLDGLADRRAQELMRRITMALETEPFDAARYLGSPEAQAELLSNAMLSGDVAYVRHALGVIARARGMAQVAREAGLSREGLYKALGPEGNPSFETVTRVARALGLQLVVRPAA
jgi:probable addiction module antidote protein